MTNETDEIVLDFLQGRKPKSYAQLVDQFPEVDEDELADALTRLAEQGPLGYGDGGYYLKETE